MSKLILQDFPPMQSAWLRYSSALAAFMVFSVFRRTRGERSFFLPRTKTEFSLVFFMGFGAFCFAPLFQMSGLVTTRATENALIVAIEPLMTVFLAGLFLGERLTRRHLLTFSGAVLGFAFLSGWTAGPVSVRRSDHLIGNLLILISLAGEAGYSVAGKKLISRYPPVGVYGTSLICGVVSLTIIVWSLQTQVSLFQIDRLTLRSCLGILWVGPLGSMIAYLLWILILTRASLTNMVLTLFIQPIFGALLGMVFLDEKLAPTQFLGAVLILAAVYWQFQATRQLKKGTVVG